MTNDAHGSPVAVRLASVATLVAAAMVRASSAAEGLVGSAISANGGCQGGRVTGVAVVWHVSDDTVRNSPAAQAEEIGDRDRL